MSTNSVIVGVGNTALGFVGTITSWFLLNYVRLLQILSRIKLMIDCALV